MNTSLRTTLAVLLLASPALAGAASADRTQPIEIESRSLDGTLAENGETHLIDGVEIRQGSLNIQAERATVTRVDGEVTLVVFRGRPASLRQVDDAGNPVNVRAQVVNYRPLSNVVDLEGSVEVDQPQGQLRGERVNYDMASGRLRAEGDGDAGRIRMRIEPRSQADGTP
ncbi:MAG: lipopolysaccharide transport periplasmic protein LptA [Aquimonas sp.]|nr:lipopolysaccharide transport periplasmic protein LptA [Aquimonas sp.]